MLRRTEPVDFLHTGISNRVRPREEDSGLFNQAFGSP